MSRDLPTSASWRHAANAEEREHTALSRCEADAIEACVKQILSLSGDGVDDAAGITSLVLQEDFSIDFFSEVMPAIERGFLSERYRPSDIQQFTLTLSDLVLPAYRSLLEGSSSKELEPFCKFVSVLVAGLVYGPSHPLAINRRWDETASGYLPLSYESDGDFRGTTIRLTQVFDSSAAYMGYSELVRPSQVVFFGRCPDAAKYMERCKEMFPKGFDVLETLMGREAVVFPIALHAAVSNVHAMLLHEGDTWWLFDLRSTNGTSISLGEDTVTVERLAEVRPGDHLRFGAPADAHDANIYWDAATVLMSLHIDLAEEFG